MIPAQTAALDIAVRIPPVEPELRVYCTYKGHATYNINGNPRRR
jgi:hypothetical protein